MAWLLSFLKNDKQSAFFSAFPSLYFFPEQSMNFILKHKILTCLDKAVYSSSTLWVLFLSRSHYVPKYGNICGLSENISLKLRLQCFSSVCLWHISPEPYKLISRILSWVPSTELLIPL